VALKCGLTGAKIANFWYKFAKGVYPLKPFFLQNLAWGGRSSQACTLMRNFTVVTFEMWAYSPKSRQNWYFWYKFDQNGYIPLSNFF